MPRFCYSKDMLEFLESEFKKLQIPELTESFNAVFCLDKTEGQIRACLKNHKFTCGRPVGNQKGFFRIFTEEQADFMRNGYQSLPLKELAEQLNTEFGTDFTVQQVRSFTRNHKVKSGRTGLFTEGHVPFNKGMKGWKAGGRSSETQFKKGTVPPNQKDMWAERICKKDGYILMKVPERNPHTGRATRYKHKHRWVWEQAHGEIPDGHVIVFLDGDKLNCDLDNLRCVPRGALQYMNQNGLNDTTGEARKAAILTGELVTVANQRARA